LYAYNGTPTGGSLPLLWSGVAGDWQSPENNSDIVPTVANGRVYVASNQQLQIFGLRYRRFRSRFGEPWQLATRPAPNPAGPPTGARYWGVVKKIAGDRIVLQLRDGRALDVDVKPAIAARRASPAPVGQAVMVVGKKRPNGSFEAELLVRAKAPSTWGKDAER
jgi:hypothetical protein